MIISQFPDSQTLTMQQEALKRVRDMQLRARQSVEQSNAFPDQTAPSQPSGPSAKPHPQFQAQPTHPSGVQQQFQQQAPLGRSPQQNMPPQNNMQQDPPQQSQPQQNMSSQGNMQQGPQRQPGFSPSNNILSHLFGGGRQSGPQNQSNASSPGGQRGYSQGGNQNAPRSGGSGLLDLLRRQGLGDSFSGLGETLQSTISSVSEPLSGLLEGFGIDGEKLVILLVMWAIFNEHKDNKMLLMALGYLLL
ncbi:hypothetical protein ACS3UN_03040 [Oscillospiraceae bacterium LTW-04]|nr:hypothetical protein RBH76_07420 [Oscillospiraceae bacterium MB24-C1]